MSGEGWTACGRGVRGEWCVRPSGHDGDCDPTLRMPAAPWRFDVPEVPAHVTALKVDGEVYLRDAATDLWLDEVDAEYSLLDLLAIRPSLVEYPDPRGVS